MRRRICGAVALAAMAGLVSSAVPAAESFRLYATQPGADRPLGLVSGGDLDGLARIGRGGGQDWTLAADGSFVRLKTSFHGTGMCLEVIGAGSFAGYARVTTCGDYRTQLWTVQGAAGSLHLSNATAGGKCLEVISGGERDGYARLAGCRSVPRQLWGKE